MSEVESCLVCCGDIAVHTVPVCNHSNVCYRCTLRMRVLMQDKKCCICKASTEDIIFTESAPKSYDSYKLPELLYDPLWNVYAENHNVLDKIGELRYFSCPVCEKRNRDHYFSSLSDLKHHLQLNHSLFYCPICVESRKAFISEQKLYTHRELQNHMKHGEVDTQGLVKGHPMCGFCNKRYYSDDELFKHMHTTHYTCHLCEQDGIYYQYYKDYSALERHFRSQHYLCDHHHCLEQKFIVFRNEVELKSHQLKMHLKNKPLSRADRMQFGRIDPLAEDFVPRREQTGQSRARDRSVAGASSASIQFMASDFPALGASTSQPLNTPSPPASAASVVANGRNRPNSSQATSSSNQKNSNVQTKAKGKSTASATTATTSTATAAASTTAASASSSTSSAPVASRGPPASPEEAKQRNAQLIKSMQEALNNNADRFQLFKQVSKDFQKGEVLAIEFYTRFIETFGKKKAKNLFPEMVDLLPDAKKREALLLAQRMFDSNEYKPPKKDKKKDKGKAVEQKQTKQQQSQQPQVVEWPTLSQATTMVTPAPQPASSASGGRRVWVEPAAPPPPPQPKRTSSSGSTSKSKPKFETWPTLMQPDGASSSSSTGPTSAQKKKMKKLMKDNVWFQK